MAENQPPYEKPGLLNEKPPPPAADKSASP